MDGGLVQKRVGRGRATARNEAAKGMPGRGGQKEILFRGVLLFLLATLAATTLAVSPAAAARGVHRRSEVRRVLDAAREHRGLPPGTSVPAWAKENGNAAYFLPGQSSRPADRGGHPSTHPEEAGLSSPRGQAGKNEANQLGLRCVPTYCPDVPLRYLGGSVQHEPTVHILFWGSNWNAEVGKEAREDVEAMYNGLSGSSYQEILTQYFDPTGRLSASVTVDSYVDTSVEAPTNVSDTAARAEIASAIEANGTSWNRGANAQYIVLPAPGTTYVAGIGSFCAYHDIDEYGSVYSLVPYAGDPPFGTTANCDGYYGEGSAARATSLLASHEYAESATDPHWNTEPGWMDLQGFEVSDICSTPYDELPNGTYVQGQYDDHQSRCSLSDESPPHVLALTEPASNISRNAATIRGTVNPESLETTYDFEYGTSTSYGTSDPVEPEGVGGGRENIAVSTRLTGLTLGQIYHYRIVATNSSGTTYGEDRVFMPAVWTARVNDMPETVGMASQRAVSCVTQSACVSVGQYFPEQNRPLTYVGGGAEWSAVTLPSPAEGEGVVTALNGVSCTSETNCIAVGEGEVGTLPVPKAARWDGSSWTLMTVPVVGGSFDSVLEDVSCVSASECIAVGRYLNHSGVQLDYAERWNGSSWSIMSTPSPSGATASVLTSVSCPEEGWCMAAGWAESGADRKVTLTWDGSEWAEQAAAVSEGFDEGVECTSARFCIAVGGWSAAIEKWNGAGWESMTTPSLAEAEGGILFGVSCVSELRCTAVGGAFSKVNGRDFTLAETWDGTSWTVQPTPRESETAFNALGGVDCSAPSRCTAVGRTQAVGWSQPLIETYAAAGEPTYVRSFGSLGSGNGQVNRPLGMAIDAEGDVWVADRENNRVEEFSATGAYLGKFGTYGTGNGQLIHPSDVAIDGEGNLWVTDSGNSRVEEFSPEGEYLGQFGSYGTENGQFVSPDGVAIAPNGDLWVTDQLYYSVSEFTHTGAFIRRVGEPGSEGGQFSLPEGIAVDGEGNVWVADRGNNRVQELSSEGEYLSEFGSEGEEDGQFKNPTVLDFLPSGNLAVADRWTGRVQEFTTHGEFLAKFGSSLLSEPEGIAAGPDGHLYIASSHGNAVKEWCAPLTPQATTVAPTAVETAAATLNGTVTPRCEAASYYFEYGRTTAYGAKAPVEAGSVTGEGPVAVSQSVKGLEPGAVYHVRVVAEDSEGVTYGNDQAFATQPTYVRSFGSLGSGNGQVNRPLGMAIDAEGDVWVADRENNRVEEFSATGAYLGKFGTYGTGNGQLIHPSDVAIDGEGNLWVTDSGNSRVEEFSPEGEYLGKFGTYGTGNGQFKNPAGIAIAPSGEMWVVDQQLSRVSEFTAAGSYIRVVGSGGSGPGQFKFAEGVAIDGEGNVWVADRGNNRVQELSPEGKYLSEFGSEGEEDGQFKSPAVLDFLPSGNLVVAERFGNRAQEFTPEGEFLTAFGSSLLSEPEGIATGPNGLVYVASSHGNAVKEWETTP